MAAPGGAGPAVQPPGHQGLRTDLSAEAVARVEAGLPYCSALYGVQQVGARWRMRTRRRNGTHARRIFDTRLEAALAHDELLRQDGRPKRANFNASGNRQRFKSIHDHVCWGHQGGWTVQVRYGADKATFLACTNFPLEQEAAAGELARRRVALLQRLRPGAAPLQQPAAASEAQLQQTARALAQQGADAEAHVKRHSAKLTRRLLLRRGAAGVLVPAHFGDRTLPPPQAAEGEAAAAEGEAAAAGEGDAPAAAAAPDEADEAMGEDAYAAARLQAAEEEEADAPVDHEFGGQRYRSAARGSSLRRVANTLGACAAHCVFCDGTGSIGGSPCRHCDGRGEVRRALAAPGMSPMHLDLCTRPPQVWQYMQQEVEQRGLPGAWYCRRYDVGHIHAVAHCDSALEADTVDSLPNLYPQDRRDNRRNGCHGLKLAQREGSSLEPGRQRFLALETAGGRRCWRRPRHRTAASGAAGGAAAAGDPAPPAQAATEQQQQQAAIDYTKTPAFVDFVYSVDGRCTLRVSGPLATEAAGKRPLSDAARAAVLAAALVALHRRSSALDAALKLAREQFPDLLAPHMLKELDYMQAAGEPQAALTVLTFGELFKLCEKVAPDVAQQIVEEIVAQGAQVQAAWLETVPPDEAGAAAGDGAGAGESAAGASAAGSAAAAAADGSATQQAQQEQAQQAPSFRVMKGIDPVERLPQRLVRTAEWQIWQRRLRDAVMAWQRQAAAEARQAAAAAKAAENAAGSAGADGQAAPGGGSQAAAGEGGPAGQAAAAQPGPQHRKEPSPLQATYVINTCTPDEVAMRHELRITVPRTEGLTLKDQLERDPFVLAQIVRDPTLAAALYAPEPLQQQFLQTAAFQLVRLGPQLSFTCTLHGAAVPAADGSSGSSGSGGSGGGGRGSDFEFVGGVADLQALVRTVAFLDGSVRGLNTVGWPPSDGRIQLRRLSAGGTGGWALRQHPADCVAFELAVWPADEGGSGGAARAAASAQQGQPAVARLSQGQLNALLDCLDAFCRQHPAFVDVKDGDVPKDPERTWLQRLAAWWQRRVSGGAGEGAAGGEGGSSGGEAGGGEAGSAEASSADSSGGADAQDEIATGGSAPGSTMGAKFV